MSKSASMYIRIDPTVKAEVEAIYSKYGMSITDAINVFLYQSRNVGGLPFDLRPSIPNAKTIEAMKEGNDIINNPDKYKGDTSADDMLADLGL